LADRRRNAPVGRRQPLYGGNSLRAGNKFGLLGRIAAGRIVSADGPYMIEREPGFVYFPARPVPNEPFSECRDITQRILESVGEIEG
jgi:hypothetical protein